MYLACPALNVNALACKFIVMTHPSDLTVETWTLLIRAYGRAMSIVEQALKENGLPQLAWYDVLLELDRAGAAGMRPYELEKALLLPQYGISRLVERIRKDGYLKRDQCTDDRRGQRLVITESGEQLRRKMWKVYGQAIEDAVGKKLTPEQKHGLAELLPRLVV